MNLNKILQSLFGNKSTRDMRLIQPLVEKVKATYDEIKALSNDQLRAKTKEIQAQVQNAAKEQKEKIAELKAQIEETPIDERETLFNQIDKLEKEALEIYEVALNELRLPISTANWLQPKTSCVSKAITPYILTTGLQVETTRSGK